MTEIKFNRWIITLILISNLITSLNVHNLNERVDTLTARLLTLEAQQK